MRTQTIEDFLLEQGLLAQADLERAGRSAADAGETLYAAIARMGLLGSDVLARAIADFAGVDLVDEDEWPADPPYKDILSTAFLRSSRVFPLSQTSQGLILAMADPGDDYARNAVTVATGQPVIARVAALPDIDAAIERLGRGSSDTLMAVSAGEDDPSDEDVAHLRDMALETPVVRLVNQLLHDAVHTRATDIHIEPFESRLSVRMRIDGMLRDVASPAAHLSKAVVSRLKILSGLNIAERRLPQDGRARLRIEGQQLDLRVATVPTVHGESMVIRLLNNARHALDLNSLGFGKQEIETLVRHLAAPHGLIVVTGPTGSGKTTTLATALSILNEPHRKILTVEDPIEYEIDGVNQTQIKPSIGLTFASALRSFLRHDPEIIMVGEMRDGETAHIGVHAALTGHLVLTTLHTNTAAGAVTRLLDMGVDAYLLASSLRCVVGQRLVRKLCMHCRQEHEAHPDFPADVLAQAGIKAGVPLKLWKAKGCKRCSGTGYFGRVGIVEILETGAHIRKLITPDASADAIERAACAAGMIRMQADGLRKCIAGLTSIEEVHRVALDI